MENEYLNPIDLPKNHKIRNLPLKEVCAECRNLGSNIWRSVITWKIKNNTFNEIIGFWGDFNEWRIRI